MQPLRATKDTGDIWLGSRGASAGTTQVNSAAFWKKKVEDVAAEDVFFHKYFQDVAKEPKPAKPSAGAAEGDEDDEKEEDEIWKALVSTHPDGEGDMDGSDVGFDDFDDEEMASLVDDDEDDESDGGVDIEGTDDEEQPQDDDDDEDDGLDELIAMDDEDEDDEDGSEEEEEDAEQPKEQSRGQKEKARRKMLRNLPTFASVDDYAAMLANEEDEDM